MKVTTSSSEPGPTANLPPLLRGEAIAAAVAPVDVSVDNGNAYVRVQALFVTSHRVILDFGTSTTCGAPPHQRSSEHAELEVAIRKSFSSAAPSFQPEQRTTASAVSSSSRSSSGSSGAVRNASASSTSEIDMRASYSTSDQSPAAIRLDRVEAVLLQGSGLFRRQRVQVVVRTSEQMEAGVQRSSVGVLPSGDGGTTRTQQPKGASASAALLFRPESQEQVLALFHCLQKQIEGRAWVQTGGYQETIGSGTTAASTGSRSDGADAASSKNRTAAPSTVGGITAVLQRSEARQALEKQHAEQGLQDFQSLKKNADLLAKLAKRVANTTSSASSASSDDNEIRKLLRDYGLCTDKEKQKNATASSLGETRVPLEDHGGKGATAGREERSSETQAFSGIPERQEESQPRAATDRRSGDHAEKSDTSHDELTVSWVVKRALANTNANEILVHDVFCLYNRLRGTDPVSPAELLERIQAESSQTRDKGNDASGSIRVGGKNSVSDFERDSIVLRKVNNVSILEMRAKAESPTEVGRRIVQTIADRETTAAGGATAATGISAAELALAWNISLGLAVAKLKLAEQAAILCRDDTVEGLFFYENRFMMMGEVF
ncbi:unnamed protein product [Amoebophrya sp. A120]|nr:unnamed protein product [Amoebophrya sp. A120]|eukprot:GSA120T00000203001.1